MTYRGAVVGLRGAVVGNNVIPTYVISRGAVVRQPFWLLGYRGISFAFVIVHVYTCKLIMLYHWARCAAKGGDMIITLRNSC